MLGEWNVAFTRIVEAFALQDGPWLPGNLARMEVALRAYSKTRGRRLQLTPGRRPRLARANQPPPRYDAGMFMVDEPAAEAIRRAYEDGGELAGAFEFKR